MVSGFRYQIPDTRYQKMRSPCYTSARIWDTFRYHAPYDARKFLCMNFIGPMSPIFHYDYFGVNFCMHAHNFVWLIFYVYFDQIWNVGFSHHFGRKYAKSQGKWAKTTTFRTVPVIKYTLPTFCTLLARLEWDFADVWLTDNSLTPGCHYRPATCTNSAPVLRSPSWSPSFECIHATASVYLTV